MPPRVGAALAASGRKEKGQRKLIFNMVPFETGASPYDDGVNHEPGAEYEAGPDANPAADDIFDTLVGGGQGPTLWGAAH